MGRPARIGRPLGSRLTDAPHSSGSRFEAVLFARLERNFSFGRQAGGPVCRQLVCQLSAEAGKGERDLEQSEGRRRSDRDWRDSNGALPLAPVGRF